MVSYSESKLTASALAREEVMWATFGWVPVKTLLADGPQTSILGESVNLCIRYDDRMSVTNDVPMGGGNSTPSKNYMLTS